MSPPSLFQAVSYTQRLDISWTLPHGQAGPRRLRELQFLCSSWKPWATGVWANNPEPSGWLFPCGSVGVWAQHSNCCHLDDPTVQISVTIWDAVAQCKALSQLIASQHKEGNKIISDCLKDLQHKPSRGSCSILASAPLLQHYSSSTETS